MLLKNCRSHRFSAHFDSRRGLVREFRSPLSSRLMPGRRSRTLFDAYAAQETAPGGPQARKRTSFRKFWTAATSRNSSFARIFTKIRPLIFKASLLQKSGAETFRRLRPGYCQTLMTDETKRRRLWHPATSIRSANLTSGMISRKPGKPSRRRRRPSPANCAMKEP